MIDLIKQLRVSDVRKMSDVRIDTKQGSDKRRSRSETKSNSAAKLWPPGESVFAQFITK